MGNKASAGDRRHSYDGQLSLDDGDRKKNKNKKKALTHQSKSLDKPDRVEPRTLDVKIYKSTSTVDEVQKRHQLAVNTSDIRVYRRSVGSTSDQPATPRGGTQTLPRNFGRNGAVGGSTRSIEQQQQQTMTRSRPDSAMQMRMNGRAGGTDDWRDTVSSGSGTVPSRNSTHSGMTSPIVTVEDFPDTPTIKRRLQQFQSRFVDRFTALYSALPVTVQLSALSIAVRRRHPDHPAGPAYDHADHAAATVSLWNYLRPTSYTDLPDDLSVDQFAPTIPPELFHRVVQLRRRRSAATPDICSDVVEAASRAAVDDDAGGNAELQVLVRDLVASVAAEAAASVATAFEYQIGLLGDGLPCQLLADRAADCAVDFLKKTNRHLDVNAVVSGVVRGGRLGDCHRVATVSVVVGNHRELKWNVDEILFRVGLRRDRLLVSASVDGIAGYGTPWRFFTSSAASDDPVDPMLYGYRGQLLLVDFTAEQPSSSAGSTPIYRIDPDEEATYDVEVMWRPDDIHRVYRPVRRLVGSDVVDAYRFSRSADSTSAAPMSLADFVQSLHGETCRRDEIEPIFRPIAVPQRRRYQQNQHPPPVAPRPRCVSDAEEFSRQQMARRTWSPAAAAAAAPRWTPGNEYRQQQQQPASPCGSQTARINTLPPADIYRRPPNSALAPDAAGKRRTVSTVTTNIVYQTPPTAPADFRHDQFFAAPPAGARRSLMSSPPPGSATREFQTPTAAAGQSTPASSPTPAATGFPTIDQLFAKELRALKAKTVHVTDFPVFEDVPTTTETNRMQQTSPGAGSVAGSGVMPSDGSEISPRAASTSSSPPVVVNFIPCQQQQQHQQATTTTPPPSVTPSGSSPTGEMYGEFGRGAAPQSPAYSASSSGGGGENGYNDVITSPMYDSGRPRTLIISNI